MRYSLLFFVCFSIGAQTAKAQPVDLARDVFPIFQARCTACHGPKSQMGQLRLDAKAIFERGGTSGKPVVAGKPDESLLVRRILASNGMSIMPPMGEPLSSENAGVIRRWIEQGAAWPQGVGADVSEVSRHWSYLRPMASTHRGRVYNIDDFIKEKLAGAGLKPSPRASKETLIRRLSLDLTGLPPTPAEVDAFLKDTDSTAYERLVDRLLASPHYGERWAQMWLDLARYADTNGYESDEPRTNWAWRDWVIKAFNRNMPFNQFTIEHLAGDLLPNPTEDQLIATGYHRNTLVNSEGGAKDDEFRDAAIKDRLENTSTVWLGSTIGCAQCHNHKYDPFSMKDYYRLYAFFNSTSESSIAVKIAGAIVTIEDTELTIRVFRLLHPFDAAIVVLRVEVDSFFRRPSSGVRFFHGETFKRTRKEPIAPLQFPGFQAPLLGPLGGCVSFQLNGLLGVAGNFQCRQTAKASLKHSRSRARFT